MNLFYNLMKAKQKNGSEYAYVLDAEIDSDGEINALAMADNAVRGPKVVEDRTELYHTIPFDLDDASIFLNGEAVGKDALEAASANMAVLYYSSMTHTIWAYTPSESSDADKRVVKGFVELPGVAVHGGQCIEGGAAQLVVAKLFPEVVVFLCVFDDFGIIALSEVSHVK